MKKFVLFVTLITLLSLFGSVMAQTPDLPAIDPVAAEPYLGTWHMDQMCEGDNCMSAAIFGLNAVLEINDDNTAVMTFEGEEPDVSYWYMEDNSAYMASGSAEDQTPIPILINEEDKLEIGLDGSSMLFTRSKTVQWGAVEVKTDAEFKDFEGEWYLESMKMGEISMPAGLLEIHGKLTIREDSFDLEMSADGTEENKDIPYELKDGTITAEIKDDEQTEKIQLQYHVDNSIVIKFSVEDGTQMDLVFVREENLTELGFSLTDLFATTNAE